MCFQSANTKLLTFVIHISYKAAFLSPTSSLNPQTGMHLYPRQRRICGIQHSASRRAQRKSCELSFFPNHKYFQDTLYTYIYPDLIKVFFILQIFTKIIQIFMHHSCLDMKENVYRLLGEFLGVQRGEAFVQTDGQGGITELK